MAASAKIPILAQLRKLGVFTLEASEVLARILRDLPSNAKTLASSVREISKEGRRLARTIIRQIDRSRVKPLDQSSYRNLCKAMNGMLDFLEQASSQCVLFGLDEPIPFTAEIAEVLCRQSREIDAALVGLCSGSPSPSHCEEIIQLKEEVDRLHESSVFNLFDASTDPIEMIKRKQIIDDLGEASKAARYIGYILRPLTLIG
jgi:uncharacterized protein Yka (UPF0111/DUF47 family)